MPSKAIQRWLLAAFFFLKKFQGYAKISLERHETALFIFWSTQGWHGPCTILSIFPRTQEPSRGFRSKPGQPWKEAGSSNQSTPCQGAMLLRLPLLISLQNNGISKDSRSLMRWSRGRAAVCKLPNQPNCTLINMTCMNHAKLISSL